MTSSHIVILSLTDCNETRLLNNKRKTGNLKPLFKDTVSHKCQTALNATSQYINCQNFMFDMVTYTSIFFHEHRYAYESYDYILIITL